ncbi:MULTISPECIES: hypothetical protein [unclassified Paenibacillus]|uniref:hypothetical protein n=1 Tax=unclassified Paenibacillus TaxID=185978 RepID=UPI002406A572|nr:MULTISPECIES: hypothetical protein [unclassified Paenibacillus]MDF9840784.1 hypothetical protein [Paenibacillus sp. PastF-2]MDF9847367.1 hypothetical protein [Paenibacillus sp. PastM-2]MDF9854055.1 hypothetical protein [Paenibacillus sp. PastF-1]MDH6479328.1 hypothetical protein [Paenibacillus sp. PastH-2]MDH6506939.1 hypothetical protein [Paenibacillus sp. PastM-3]
MGNSAKVRRQAKQLKGRKVCVTLHDGRTYVGWITGCEKEGVVLSVQPRARKKAGSASTARAKQAEVSAFMPLLGPLLGNLGGAGGAGAGLGGLMGGGLGGLMGGGLRFFGLIRRAMPVVKMGYGMIKQIRPFMNGLKGLMNNE